MNKMRIGDLVVTSNEKFHQTPTTVFTKNGYQKVNLFLVNESRDFRRVFPFLCEMYETQPATFYDSTFRKVLKQSGAFYRFLIAITVQQLMKIKIPFEIFYPPLIEDCYREYQENKDRGGRTYLVGAFHSLVSIYPKAIPLIPAWVDSIDVTENIHFNRLIYVDEHIALTYNPDIQNEGLGELLFAARNSSGLWSFDKTDKLVPASSLRRAKKALAEYQGKPRRGKLVGNDAERFSRFLGLEVRDGYAYMPNYKEPKNYRGKGFK